MAMKRMLNELAAQDGFASFEEGHEPFDDTVVAMAVDQGLLRIRLVSGNSIDVHYELTDKAREMYGLPPTLERRIWLWFTRLFRQA